MFLARRLPSACLAACAVIVSAAPAASAYDACTGEGVRFTLRGDGDLVKVDPVSGAEVGPVEGRILRYDEQYRANGVAVTFSQKGVRYTAASGATFKPGCATPTAAGRGNSWPAPYLTRGRIDVSAPRSGPSWHGVNTYEGVFYGRRGRRTTSYTVRRSYRGDDEFRAKSILTVRRGSGMILTPYSDIAAEHSCRRGRTISITSSGRIRGG